MFSSRTLPLYFVSRQGAYEKGYLLDKSGEKENE